MKAWTIGTSTRSKEDFLNLLKLYDIESIIDVRRFPTSRFEHFKKENLEELLQESKIAYCHLRGLGGYRGGYQAHMETEEFKSAFSQLCKMAKRERTVIMCAELLFFRCHRRFISDALVKHGFEVIHILDEERTNLHKGGK
ncbi:MAG: DUF488 family protein [Thermoplasmata archaeon]